MVLNAGGLYSISHPFSIGYLASRGGSFANGVQVKMGSGGNTAYVQGVAAGSWMAVNTGAGDDRVVVSSAAGTLDGFNGSLYLDEGAGNNALTVSGASATQTVALGVNASVIYGLTHSFAINYTATGGTFAGGIVVQTGAGNDQVLVVGKRADAPTLIETGSGAANIYVTVNNSGALNGLMVDGQTGSATLFIHDASGGMTLEDFPSSTGWSVVDAVYRAGPTTSVFYRNIRSAAQA
jgi:hypothetical protein